MECLTFLLGKERFAVDILRVREIRVWSPPTRLPAVPAYVSGVINLRGMIVPILDLRQRFGLGERQYDANTVTLILGNGEERLMGLVVDAVADVLALADQDRVATRLGHSAVLPFLQYLVRHQKQVVAVLDVDALMDLDKVPNLEDGHAA
ncbi:chemotaxis protein CheW [Gallaecimonas xiamenensis]|uniref:Chemotaxis protein CheW n=1 Tax=Gallaecimonas xiamenensis 3-C-1 TaxID=745411 RepID=K2JKH7_9GAMM|nr:chemotaxis protein CheW [Gallaecimonas xiamenensis]EKE71049.1 Positive regulator of CheA protein activity (CheW) [Gallaecimonas xiamenensis 3-C-1]